MAQRMARVIWEEEEEMVYRFVRTVSPAALAALVLLAVVTIAWAKDAPEHVTVGQTIHFSLDKDETKDYLISLDNGSYWIVWDGRRTDGAYSNMIGTVQLLRNNGSMVDPTLLTWNELGKTSRTGKQFHVAKPLPARLRLHNQEAETAIWLTVVPVSSMRFLPFGFGAEITPSKIGAPEGVGGTLERNETAYQQITLPTGKWNISLGLSRPDGKNSNVMGRVDLLDPYGFTTHPQYIVVNEIAKEARQQATFTAAKPRPLMFRIVNLDNSSEINYDLTIEKAMD
jgi:hypothetical protein